MTRSLCYVNLNYAAKMHVCFFVKYWGCREIKIQ